MIQGDDLRDGVQVARFTRTGRKCPSALSLRLGCTHARGCRGDREKKGLGQTRPQIGLPSFKSRGVHVSVCFKWVKLTH